MFDLFNRKTAKDFAAEAKERYGVPVPTPWPQAPEPDDAVDKPAYQIGKTEDGQVTFRMGTDTNWTQLTMNNEGVRSLIRMLEAAMDDDEAQGETKDA